MFPPASGVELARNVQPAAFFRTKTESRIPDSLPQRPDRKALISWHAEGRRLDGAHFVGRTLSQVFFKDELLKTRLTVGRHKL